MMFSAVESMPVWQQDNARQPTKPTTKQQNVTRASNLSNPIQRTSNIPSPRRNQTLLNALSISMDRTKNVPPGTINSAGGTSKSCPNSPWGKNIIGNTQSKSHSQAILSNPDHSERNHFGDRKSHDPTRLSGVTTRHQIQRNENKLGNLNAKLGSSQDQAVLGPLMPSGYSHTRHFSGASHWQITDQSNGNQSLKPTRISTQQTGNVFSVIKSYAINKEQDNTSYLEGQRRGPTGYTSYIPDKDGQSWKVSPEFKTPAKPTAGNSSKRDTLENYAKASDSIRSPRNTTGGSSRSRPLPKISPYGPIPVVNTGGSPRAQTSLMKSSKHMTVSPRHLANSKRVISCIGNTNEASRSLFNSQISGASTNMKGDAKRPENNKKISHSNNDSFRANTNSKPPSKTPKQKSSMQPRANSFRKVKSQLQMAMPKSKSLCAKDDSLKGSQKRAQNSKLHNGNVAPISIEDEDSDEEIWSKTIFDCGNLIKSAERRIPHLLSDYQTLFPAVSPTCQSLPSVVTSQGDRQAGIPRRVRAHPPKRTSSPTNYLSRMLVLSDSASFYGSPLWRPIQRKLSHQKLNDNNNNAHSVQPHGYTKTGIHVILEDLAEEQNIITESTTPKENNILGQKSALIIRPYLDAMVSKVTSSHDVSLEDLRVNLKHSMYSQQYEAPNKADSTVPDNVRMDILEQAVDDAISIVQAQRQAAAQKVASNLADLLLLSVERSRKQKKAQTSQSVISKFWESDI